MKLVILFATLQSNSAFVFPKINIPRHISTNAIDTATTSTKIMSKWSSDDLQQAKDQHKLWPLDKYNIKLLNEVHPKSWVNKKIIQDEKDNESDDNVYDFIAIGAGAGGLVSSRQAARRGAKSAMVSFNLAGGDCLNVGCVPSKALIRSARMIREVRKGQKNSIEDFGVRITGSVEVDFSQIMRRMRMIRSDISPIDGHERGEEIGVDVFQGFGRFVDENTIEVVRSPGEKDPVRLRFKKAAICTGGRATIPMDIPGLDKAPYTTNETLFNLTTLPNRMVILGSGVVALEMAQVFATFGSRVTVLVRGDTLFPNSDPTAGPYLQKSLEEKSNIEFIKLAKVINVETLKEPLDENDLPLMRLSIRTDETEINLEADCLLVATGRSPNVENLNLEAANVDYDPKQGILVNDHSRSITNSNIYSVGDCTAGVPRLTHMSGEMAKVVINNALFDDDWKLSSLVVPSCMYTEPEFATVGHLREGDDVDVYTASLEHNDRSILDGEKEGYVKILCQKNSAKIIGCSIIAGRAGELINEVTLAMKHGISLEGIGRNIHCYPTTGEGIMSCGLQFINSRWKVLE